MDAVHAMMVSPAVTHLIMTFLHSLWQGALLAGVLWCLFHALDCGPGQRYALNLLALLTLVVVMFFTYAVLELQAGAHPPIALQADAASGPRHVAEPPSQALPGSVGAGTAQATTQDRPSTAGNQPSKRPAPVLEKAAPSSPGLSWQAYVFVLWLGGLCLMTGRMCILISGAFRLRRTCTRQTDERLRQQFDSLKGLMHLTGKVALGYSKRVLVPCTVGCLRPMIILPASMAGMDAQTFETVLLHELAHIKRLDWLMNIIQMLVESVLFFNPAVWWISYQMRIEREAACDAHVIAHTQKPVQYAQLLLRFAAVDHQPLHAVALAFGATPEPPDRASSSLGERIRRLVVPGYRPNVHPGIIPVLLTLAALAFCGVGAYKTSSVTVRYFGRHMTPQQRADTVLALKDTYPPKPEMQADLPKDQWIQVKGKVVTADGQPLPLRTFQHNGRDCTHVDASLMTRTHNCSSSQSLAQDGSFEFAVRQSRFTLSVVCKGYAARHVPLECEPGASIEDLEIMLQHGYPASIRFLDPEGQPIASVKVTGGFPAPPDYGGYIHSIQQNSDQEGVIRFDHASDALMTLTCQAPGFVKTRQDRVHLIENEMRDWILMPAPPSHISVSDRQTGLPLQDAAVYVNGKEFHSSFGGQQQETQTDAAGQAVLDSLAPGEHYLILIHPAGRQRQYFTITAGESIQAEFDPVRPIKGRVVGDLTLLAKDDKGPYLRLTNTYQESDHSSFSNAAGKAYVEVINDKEAAFQVDDYYGHRVTLSAADQEYTVNIERGDALEGIVINLSPQEIDTQGMRKLTFTLNNAQSAGEGNVFALIYRQAGSQYAKAHEIAVVDGQAEVYVTVPNSITWEPASGSPLLFERGHERLTEDRDHHFQIDCKPAGSVFGTVTVPPAFRYKYTCVNITCLNRGELVSQTGHHFPDGLNLTSQAQTKFMFGPLPLGGRYRVTLKCDTVYAVSEEIQLTDQQPLCELALPWPRETITLRGRILNPDGSPAAHMAYNITAHTEGNSHGFGTCRADENGQFVCTNINPVIDIDFSIRVEPDRAPRYEYALNKSEKPVTLRLKEAVVLRGVLKDHAGNIQPNAQFALSPKRRVQRAEGYCSQQINTDGQGRFQAYMADIDYTYFARRRLQPTDDGRVSYTGQSIALHPGRDQDVTVVMDPSGY